MIALMMEATNAAETSVSIYQITGCNIPGDSRVHTSRREDLKSHSKPQPLENSSHMTQQQL
jgi:hypothetical protein